MDILVVGNRILHFQWKPELLGIVQRYFFAPGNTALIPGIPITLPGSAEN